MKALIISNRPAQVLVTREALAALMPWLAPVVVVMPGRLLAEQPNDTWIAEESLIGETVRRAWPSLSHVERNITLRRAAIASGLFSEPFLMMDDDYRPLRPIGEDAFVQSGRQRGYFSHDLKRWREQSTDYDLAQRATLSALQTWGMPTLGYGAHMPQVIDPQLWHEAFSRWDALGAGNRVDEWSLVHNVGRSIAPERYLAPEPYRTLGWPAVPYLWPQQVEIARYDFENFDPAHYAPRGLFAGLPEIASPTNWAQVLFAKLERWNAFAADMAQLLPRDTLTPLTGRFWHRPMYATARVLRRALRIVDIERRQ